MNVPCQVGVDRGGGHWETRCPFTYQIVDMQQAVYRDVEDLLAERGFDVSYETVRSWVLAAISQTGEVHRDPGSEKIVLQQWFVSGLKGNPDADGV